MSLSNIASSVWGWNSPEEYELRTWLCRELGEILIYDDRVMDQERLDEILDKAYAKNMMNESDLSDWATEMMYILLKSDSNHNLVSPYEVDQIKNISNSDDRGARLRSIYREAISRATSDGFDDVGSWALSKIYGFMHEPKNNSKSSKSFSISDKAIYIQAKKGDVTSSEYDVHFNNLNGTIEELNSALNEISDHLGLGVEFTVTEKLYNSKFSKFSRIPYRRSK